MTRHLILAGLLPALTAFTLRAQFTDVSAMLNANIILEGNLYGNGVSFYDFTGDGWDDLTVADGAQAVRFYINNNGTLQSTDLGISNTPAGQVSMTLWADYDNDGDQDLLITKQNQRMQLWRNNGNLAFTNVAVTAGLEQLDHNYWGASWCDVDHDGLLDLFVSKYYHPVFNPQPVFRSILYHNNGDGTFSDVTVASGIDLPPRPTFQGVFFDYNADGWEDLFLVIDRQSFSNELFENNGDGTFSNVTMASNTGQHMCSMTGTVGDYDNDADLDLYVTNSLDGNLLLKNNGDETFADVSADMGVVVNQNCWGSLWIDYDNNTWQDLMVSVTSPFLTPVGNQFFINEEGLDFSEESSLAGLESDPSQTYMVAMGDLNTDGYYDFVWNNDEPFPAKLYRNNGGDNHYLSVSLEGVLANRDGIGSWIHCYAGGNHYVRYTICGEDFLGQSSGKEIFGLGAIAVVDSLVIDWNSGTHDVYERVAVNQTLFLTEGGGISANLSQPALLCPGDSVLLHAEAFASYLWSNGAVTQDIYVDQPGLYALQVVTGFGAILYSDTVEVLAATVGDISLEAANVSCFGLNDAAVSLLPEGDYAAVNWSDGVTGVSVRSGLGIGWLSVNGVSAEGCAFADSVLITQPEPMAVAGQVNHVTCHGASDGQVLAEVSGGSLPYTLTWLPGGPDALGAGTYTLHAEDANGCETDAAYEVVEPAPLWFSSEVTDITCAGFSDGAIDVEVSGGTQPIDLLWSSGNGEALGAGTYTLYAADALGCQADTTFIISDPLELTLALGSTPQVGATGGTIALGIAGGISPYTIIWSTGATDSLLLTGLASGFYSVLVTDAAGCEITDEVQVEFVSSIQEWSEQDLRLWPNPSAGEVFVALPAGCSCFRVINMEGRVVVDSAGNRNAGSMTLDLAPGVYQCAAWTDCGILRKTLVVIRKP